MADMPFMSAIEPTTKPSERRRSKRQPCSMEAFIISPTATNPYERREVSGVNLSKHGIAFAFVEPIAADTYWLIEIGVGDQRLVSEVRIIDCRAIEDGLYQVGSEFC